MYIRKYISVYKKIYRSIYENIFPHMRKFRHLLGAIKTLTLNYLASEVRYSSRIRRHSELLRCFDIFSWFVAHPNCHFFSVHDTTVSWHNANNSKRAVPNGFLGTALIRELQCELLHYNLFCICLAFSSDANGIHAVLCFEYHAVFSSSYTTAVHIEDRQPGSRTFYSYRLT